MMNETNSAMAAGIVIQKYNSKKKISNQQPTKTECMQRVVMNEGRVK